MKTLPLVFSLLIILSCSAKKDSKINIIADDVNGGLELPEGFHAVVFADNIGRARHIAVNDNGDVYVNLRTLNEGKGLVALRDSDKDGKADIIEYFGNTTGTGIDIKDNMLYYSSDSTIYRVPITNGQLLPQEDPEVLISELTDKKQHAAKSFTIDDQGSIFVNIGAPANACMEEMRTPGSPGMDPCPILEYAGGIWRFDINRTGQKQLVDGYRFSTGIRNAVAIDYNPNSKKVYIMQHGRDQLNQFFPDMYTAEQNAELPAEEFFMLHDGADFGWPYCYYDQIQNKKVLAPEYGGDGQITDRCATKDDPIMAFPGHWGPNALLFYSGKNFPEKYQNGAFIAFHGSWNRAPMEQKGYCVAFVPFTGDSPSGEYEIFAKGFSGLDIIESPGDSKYRPTGLALGPDGSIFITDSVNGRIWKVFYDNAN